MESGKNGMGSKWEKEREEQIKGVRDRV